jgi:exodeoxyribonuclease-5
VLTADQKHAYRNILKWIEQPSKQFLTMGGYAGTGKTTLLAYLRRQMNRRKIYRDIQIAFACYTGKAANVLRQKLLAINAIEPDDFCSTIHRLIYKPIEDDAGNIIEWVRRDSWELRCDLIIIDEGSMVNQSIWKDLLSFNRPILVVGDHGQLPPVDGTFNLMENPDLRLETIMRQAADNPIIELSRRIRQGGRLSPGKIGSRVICVKQLPAAVEKTIYSRYSDQSLVLCARNQTRNRLNSRIRQALGYIKERPEVGERVICLKNDRRKNIYNGMLGRIAGIKSHRKYWYRTDIKLDGEPLLYHGQILKGQFGRTSTIQTDADLKASDINTTVRKMGNLFDWGYALTVHKAQGSEAPNVLVYDEYLRAQDKDLRQRWLYTAITRSTNNLVVVSELM